MTDSRTTIHMTTTAHQFIVRNGMDEQVGDYTTYDEAQEHAQWLNVRHDEGAYVDFIGCEVCGALAHDESVCPHNAARVEPSVGT